MIETTNSRLDDAKPRDRHSTNRRVRRVVMGFMIVVGSLLALFLTVGDRITGGRVVTDGSHRLDDTVWRDAMRFSWTESGALPLTEEAVVDDRAPSFHPAAPDIYFARRSDDTGWDLFRSRWTPKGYVDPEPLFELNTRDDETDPVLVDGGRALVFASNRDGGLGGYDLYRSDLVDDGFGRPESLGRPLNSPSDDRHAMFDRTGHRTLLTSSRLSEDGIRLDLYQSIRKTDGTWRDPELLQLLDDSSDQRSPTLDASASVLVFASDREGGPGGYDLYRSVRINNVWRPAEPLVALNTEADELDPSFSPEGLTLAFARTRPDGDGLDTAIHLAQRRQVFALDDSDPAWRTLLYILSALLIALLLLWLYLKWGSLHPFVKFIILSLIIHLLVMLFADPEPEMELPPGSGGGEAFKVSFIRSDSESASGGATAAVGENVSADRAAVAMTSDAPAASASQAPSIAPTANDDARLVARSAPAESASDLPARSAVSRQSASAAVSESARSAPQAMDASARRTGNDAAASAAAVSAATSVDVARLAGSAPSAAPSASDARTPAPATEITPGGSGSSVQARDVTLRDRATEGDRSGTAASRQAVANLGGGLVTAKTGVATPSPGTDNTALGESSIAAPSPDASAGTGRRRSTTSGSAGDDTSTLGGGPSATPELARAGSALRRRGTESIGDGDATADAGSASTSVTSPTRSSGAPRLRAAQANEGGGATTAAARSGEAAREAHADWNGPAGAKSLQVARAAGSGSSSRSAALPTGTTGASAELDGPSLRRSGLRRRGRGSESVTDGESPSRLLSRRRSGAPRLSSGPATASTRRPGGGRDDGTDETMNPGEAGGADSPTKTDAVGRGPAAPSPVVTPRHSPRLASSGRTGSGFGEPLAFASHAISTDVAPRSLLRRRAAQLGSALDDAGHSSSPPPIYANRRGRARLEALMAAGGDEETEAAVLNGLRYLKNRQRRNGAWGRRDDDDKYGDIRIGKSGLALLAYLGSGFTHDRDGEFRDTVKKGVDFLVERVGRRTGHIGEGSSYGHGIATYALAEAYAMTRDEKLEAPLRRAVQRIVNAQVTSRDRRVDGGWRYYYRDENKLHDRWPRLSVTVWQIMALESARIGGLRVSDRVLTRARQFVRNSFDRDQDAFMYNLDPGWRSNRYVTLPGSNSAALFAMQILGVDANDGLVRRSVDFCLERPPSFRWRRPSTDRFVENGWGNEYFLYYATLGLRLYGGEAWDKWNARLKPLLLRNQSDDGSWEPISYYADYAKDTDRDRSYTTAMCVLMLEVYYRYDTPLLQKLAKAIGTADTAPPPRRSGPHLIVLDIDDDASVARAGLQEGDIIVSVNGRSVRTIDKLEELNATLEPRDRVRLRIRRGERLVNVEVRGALGGFSVREAE